MNIRKKVAATVAALMAVTLTLCSCGTDAIAPYGAQPSGQSAEGQQQQEEVIKESAFVTIDINPSIELVMNEDRIVTSVGAANADAEVLLWQEEQNIVGQDIEAAVARITALAVEMGYLTEENADISVTVTTKGGKTEQALLTAIDETIAGAVKDTGIEVKVEEAVDLVLSRELARVKEENVGKPGYDDTLTLSRYRLIKSALKADRELTMDVAVQMTNEKLTAVVDAVQANAEAKFGATCSLAMSEAEFNYENAKQTLLDSAYTAVYTSRMNLSSLLANYGAMYAGYRLAYRTIEHYGETMLQLIENPIFTSDDVFALANALGIDTSAEADYDAFKAAITDKDGNITRDSVNAYINEQYKKLNAEDREKLEAAYDSVMDILDTLEAEASIIREDGYALINSALLGMNISVEVKTYEDLPALLAAIQQKIDTVYAKMESDMTENEKADVLERQEAMSQKIAEQEKTLQDAVNTAHKEAEDRLNAAKEQAKERANGTRKGNDTQNEDGQAKDSKNGDESKGNDSKSNSDSKSNDNKNSKGKDK